MYETYKIHWMENQTVPDEILELVACDCKKGKRTEQCQRVLLHVLYTDICKCKGECQFTPFYILLSFIS